MALSNTITTILRDPYAHSKYRTEFRLDDENLYMLPSMRLCNLGAWSAQLDDDTGVYYLPLTGVASCIQSIALYLNGTLVDNNDDVAVSVALRNLRKSNAENQDIGRWTSMAGLGFDVGTYENPTNLCLTLSSKWYENAHVQGGVDHDAAFGMWQVADNDQGTSGSVLLGDLLEFVRTANQSGVPAMPAKDVRIVITWNMGSSGFVQDPDAATQVPSIESLGLQPMRPFLICDQLVGVPPQPKMQLTYFSTIVEKLPLPAGINGVPLIVNRKSMAFNQKMLNDLTIVLIPSGDDAAGRWQGQLNQFLATQDTYQLVLNGANFLPNQGDSHAGFRLYYANDAFGSMNIPMAGYVEYLGASDLILEYPDTECATADLTGAVNVASYKIGQMVDRLQVNYQRASWSGDHDACTLYLLGRVARVLTLNGDQVSLAS